MSYLISKVDQEFIRDAYQENNAASTKMVKFKLRQMVDVLINQNVIKLESENLIIANAEELENWCKSYLNLDLKTFLEK